MNAAIETYRLCKAFKPRAFPGSSSAKVSYAVRDVTMRIEKGEVCALIGRNGAGKTTLIKLLSTLVLPTYGTARINGFDVTRDGSRVRTIIGLVSSDERSFHWRLSGRENLLFFAVLQNMAPREAAKRAAYLLDLMELSEKGEEYFQNYSTGMRQRLAIARGLLHDPEVLLMDEPTRGVDPERAAGIRSFIYKELVERRGKTILVATHDIIEIEDICDSVLLLRDGCLVAKAEVKTIQKGSSLKEAILSGAIGDGNGY